MTTDEQRMFEELLAFNKADESILNALKNIATPYGVPQPIGCWCKQVNKDTYLTQLRDWYINHINDNE